MVVRETFQNAIVSVVMTIFQSQVRESVVECKSLSNEDTGTSLMYLQ